MKGYDILDKRLTAKFLPRNINNEFMGPENVSTTSFTCPYCGMQLYHYDDGLMDHVAYWACYTTNCPNNPDRRTKFEVTVDGINNAGNTDRNFIPFVPRRIL